MAADKLRAAEQTKGLHTFFKLQTTISCDNMVLFDQNGCMKKYNDAGEILKDFYDLRFAFYGKRKQYLEGKRSILQTFWKTDCVTRSLFFESETSNFWLLAYFFISLSCANFQQDWTTLISHIL